MFFNQYSKRNVFLSLIIILSLIILVNVLFPSKREHLCAEEQIMKERSLDGKIKNKYIDKENHNYEIIEYIELGTPSDTIKLNLTLDTGKLFNTLKPGDYIRKEKEALLVHINKGDTSIRIDYGVQCNGE